MSGPDRLEPPDDLRELDQALAGIRFLPREGFGAELAGRAARAEAPALQKPAWRRRTPLAAAACTAALLLVGWAGWNARVVTVDRCCYDLDGGTDRDDGVLVRARRNEDVRRLAVYEDRDGSRSYTEGDLLRFSRGSEPTLLDPAAADLVTMQHCCLDFDGGGPDDDGLLIVGVPPDRVMMVALYEESSERTRSGWLLR
ncbi:MAG: hypothetical protein ACREOC_08780 [Gemmatimonadales bacterium]